MIMQNVVITGAGSGLGAALANKFSSQRSHVCLLGRTRSKLLATAKNLESSSSIYEVDITSNSAVKEVMEEITKEHGTIDCLVNNAGIGVFKLLEELREDEMTRMIDTNLKGTIFCTQHALTTMKANNKGLIINIVSASGKRAKETESVYGASKFGVRGFAEAMKLELKDTNIRLFSVYMGNMKTELWSEDEEKEKLNTYMDPDDVAEIIINSVKPKRHVSVTDITILNE